MTSKIEYGKSPTCPLLITIQVGLVYVAQHMKDNTNLNKKQEYYSTRDYLEITNKFRN